MLINRSLAIITDARVGRNTDLEAVAEIFLSVSGEDPTSVPRKFRQDWTGFLKARFLILSNGLIRFRDPEGTLSSRFTTIFTKVSFAEHEDYGLQAKLESELDGIVQWAMVGYRRLTGQTGFGETEESRSATDDLRRDMVPMIGFVEDILGRGSATDVITVKDLYRMYRHWCEQTGHRPLTDRHFSRELLKVCKEELGWSHVTRGKTGVESERALFGLVKAHETNAERQAREDSEAADRAGV